MITIEKTGEHFRLIYDVKGRFCVHRITAEEAKVSVKYRKTAVEIFQRKKSVSQIPNRVQ